MATVTGKTAIKISMIRSEALLIQEALFRYAGKLQDQNTSMAMDVAKIGYQIQDKLAATNGKRRKR